MDRREFIKWAGLAAAFPCGIASAVKGGVSRAEIEKVRKILHGTATDKRQAWPPISSMSHKCNPLNFCVTYQARILNDDFVHVLTLPEDLTEEEQRQIETRIDEYNESLEVAK